MCGRELRNNDASDMFPGQTKQQAMYGLRVSGAASDVLEAFSKPNRTPCVGKRTEPGGLFDHRVSFTLPYLLR